MEEAPDKPDRGGALEVSSTEPAHPYLAGYLQTGVTMRRAGAMYPGPSRRTGDQMR